MLCHLAVKGAAVHSSISSFPPHDVQTSRKALLSHQTYRLFVCMFVFQRVCGENALGCSTDRET